MNPSFIYSGFIMFNGHGWKEGATMDDYSQPEALFLSDNKLLPLCERVKKDIGNRAITCSYYITENEMSFQEAKENIVLAIYGLLDVYHMAEFSETSGWLYCNERLEIGGHDLVKELLSHEGKYVHLCFYLNEKHGN